MKIWPLRRCCTMWLRIAAEPHAERSAPPFRQARRQGGRGLHRCRHSDPKPPWRERKEKLTFAHLNRADADTRLVSAADKLNNVRSILSDYRAIGESVWSRFNGGREGTLWYYRTLLDVFLGHKPNRITRDLELAVNELDSLARGKRNSRRHKCAHPSVESMTVWRARSIKSALRSCPPT